MQNPAAVRTFLASIAILATVSVKDAFAVVAPVALPAAVVILQDGDPSDNYNGPLLSPITEIGQSSGNGYDIDTAYGSPSPGISVSIKGSTETVGYADLKYYFEIVGPANTVIPLNISGTMTNSPCTVSEGLEINLAQGSPIPTLDITPGSLGGGGVIPFNVGFDVMSDTVMQVELSAEGATDFAGSPSEGYLAIDPIISISSLLPVPAQEFDISESPGIGNLALSTPEPGAMAILAGLGAAWIGFVRRRRSS